MIKKKLDILWSLIVKKRAGGVCEVCGKSTSLNSHHIISRSHLVLRWDVRNGCCLCVSHHSLGNHSAHKDSQWFMLWLFEFRTEDYEYLVYKKNDVFDKDYIRIEDELKEAQ